MVKKKGDGITGPTELGSQQELFHLQDQLLNVTLTTD